MIKPVNLITSVLPDEFKLQEPLNELAIPAANYRKRITGLADQFYYHIGKLLIVGSVAPACNRHWLYTDLVKHAQDPLEQDIKNDRQFSQRTRILYDEYVSEILGEVRQSRKLSTLLYRGVIQL